MASTLSVAAQSHSLNSLASSNKSQALRSTNQRIFQGACRINVPQTRLVQGRQNLTVRAEGPPKKFTGYVEKDTAGQENIYAVEPTIYVAESAISTNSKGTSAEGSGGTLIISTFLAVAAVAGAAAVLFTVSSSQPASVDEVYNGPPLEFYIQKFKAPESVAPSLVESSVESPVVVEDSVEAPAALEASAEFPGETPAAVEENADAPLALETSIEAPVETPAVVEETVQAPLALEVSAEAAAETPAVVQEVTEAPTALLETVEDVASIESTVASEVETTATDSELLVEAAYVPTE